MSSLVHLLKLKLAKVIVTCGSFQVTHLNTCPKSLLVHGQARLFRVVGFSLPSSMSTSLYESKVF
jgi:hypothetical protein